MVIDAEDDDHGQDDKDERIYRCKELYELHVGLLLPHDMYQVSLPHPAR
jgi:hypothetical protein